MKYERDANDSIKADKAHLKVKDRVIGGKRESNGWVGHYWVNPQPRTDIMLPLFGQAIS
jgi:hypothetical protein